MSDPLKVHLFGSENIGWALDTDSALTRKSLQLINDRIELTSFEKADVIHSVWEEPLFALEQNKLEGKRIICHACNDLLRLYENPLMIRAADTVGLWVAMSRAAVKDFETLQFPFAYVPYSVDTDIFCSDDGQKTSGNEFRKRNNIPNDTFVISNFMRDSFGHDLQLPKDQKGAELLVETGRRLKEKGLPVQFLLAGPRRHWLRAQLKQLHIPYTFVGDEIDGDDITRNILSAEQIRVLYKASDLHLITSRWEGGPRSVLEAAATKTPILCTPVGIAQDVLKGESLFHSVDEAVEKVVRQIENRFLDKVLEDQYKLILQNHTVQSNVSYFRKLYDDFANIKPYMKVSRWVEKPVAKPSLASRVVNVAKRLSNSPPVKKKLCISLWHEFHKPPYGGGNQFMMALKSGMERQGVKVVVNKLSSSVDVHICNSCWFDIKKFEKKTADFPVRMIHRIDGPVTLYRGEGRTEDETIFSLNERFASASVFQSAYCFRKSYELGFRAVSPVVIHNGVDNTIFYPHAFKELEKGRKIRLISSAWSDNPRKGGPFLKWLDENLDWERFEYTFVGRVKETFTNIRHVDAVPSEDLADFLRTHDIYVSVSLHEPCSNALIEALNCGLPALYRDDGGNPELVSFGGVPFQGEKDVLGQLDRLTNNYESFKRLIYLRTMDDIAARYIGLAERVCAWVA